MTAGQPLKRLSGKLGLSAVVYAVGLTSLLLADILVTNHFSPNTIADWATFRSLVGIAAILPLVGLDQVLIRSPQSSERLLRIIAAQGPLLAGTVGIGMYMAGFVSQWWIGTGLAIGSFLSLALFQYFRSHHIPLLSQLSQQTWKIAALVALIWIAWTGVEANIFLIGVSLLLLANAIGLGALLWWPPKRHHDQTPEPFFTLYAIGLRFMATSLLLALSVYAEQLVVNQLGSTQEAALYFTAATYFLFPAGFLNGYAAFLIGPWIRDNRARFLASLKRHRTRIVFGILFYALILSGIGWAAWALTTPSVGDIDHGLQTIFTLSVMARTAYVIPSGYIGVFGKPRQHDVLIWAQIAALGLAALLLFALWSLGVGTVYAVALASALNWALRAGLSFGVMAMIARSHGGSDVQR